MMLITNENRNRLRSILDLAKGNLLGIIVAILLGCIACIFGSSLMFTSGYMISLAATIPLTVLALHIPSIFVRIFGVGKPLIDYFQRLVSHDWVLRLTTRLRVKYFNILTRLCKSPLNTRSYGEILAELTEDVGKLQEIFLRCVVPVLIAYLVFVVVLIALGAMSALLAIIFAALLLISILLIPAVAIRRSARFIHEKQKLTSELYILLVDSLIGAKDLILADLVGTRVREIVRLKERSFSLMRKIEKHNRQHDLLSHLSFSFIIVLLFCWASASFAHSGHSMEQIGFLASLNSIAVNELSILSAPDSVSYAANWITAFSICFFPMVEVFTGVSDSVLSFVRYETSIDNFESAQCLADSQKGTMVGLRSDTFNCDQPSYREEADEHIGFIELKNISFSYPSSNVATIEGLNLEIQAGEKLAILGRSGEGKTTILELIRRRFEPVSGSIHINGKVGYIEQDPYIFNMSIRENLLIANGRASDYEMSKALESAGLTYLLEKNEGGLDHVLLEAGSNISGGERSRIAIARLLLADCDIVILDEPFVSLDQNSENDLIDLILDIFSDKTIVLVTHHLLGVDRFDRVCFVGNGRIEYQGSLDDLAAVNDEFKELSKIL